MAGVASASGIANGTGDAGISSIVAALELVYSANTTNQLRHEASEYLESLKQDDNAPYRGFVLTADANNSPLVRHYGLSLLEYFIRHKWMDLSDEQTKYLRQWVLELAGKITPNDASYLRNKIAALWAEVAKRSWALDWMDMDQALLKLWNLDIIHKDLVLTVLETLSEDVFYREDLASALRGNEINDVLVEVFTPLAVLDAFPNRDGHQHLRAGEEGWLYRLSSFLDWCIGGEQSHEKLVQDCALKALAALKSAMSWSIKKAITSTHCVDSICKTLSSSDSQILLSAIESLHSLYSRSDFEVEAFETLVAPMYRPVNIEALKKVYHWSIVDAQDIDESRYVICKKFSEMMAHLSSFMRDRALEDFPEGTDIAAFLQFLIVIVQNQSLTVSIPVMHAWTKLMLTNVGDSNYSSAVIGPLLEICSQRLLPYESLPQDSDDPVIIFLNEDIDTVPEKHAFVGNYRRFCSHIIDIIVQRRPREAIPHILSQVDSVLDNLYNGVPPPSIENYDKRSIPIMRFDTQFTVVEAALKGYSKWVSSRGRRPQEDEQERQALEQHLEAWAIHLMGRTFEDPTIKQKVMRLAVECSAKCLDKRPDFALKVLEHILVTHPPARPEHSAYSDAVRELYHHATHELRRLAIKFADYFASFYVQLMSKIEEILNNYKLDERLVAEYSVVLLAVMQRATNVDYEVRKANLQKFIQPVRVAWTNPQLSQAVSSFDSFCNILGLNDVGPYLQYRDALKFDDWSEVGLDEAGLRLQETVTEHSPLLPFRSTKTLVAVSTDKLKHGEPAYMIACELWHDQIPAILPVVLNLVKYAHAFHRPSNWSNLPPDQQPLVGRLLSDRFWQAGISTGSREDFYNRITSSRKTLEGFASSVRGKIRSVRESCYSILYGLSRLGQHFYGLEELPGPLSEALFADADALSSHQFSLLLGVSKFLIDDCPVRFRTQFLPSMLVSLFTQIDRKVGMEWEIIEQRKTASADDDLTEEMKEESILRQLTYTAVMMVANLLDPARIDSDLEQEQASAPKTNAGSMRTFILSSPAILEPLILFCTHALRMRDSRCCSYTTRVLRSILPEFLPDPDTQTAAALREFISNDVLKACITSVHEPYFVDLQRDLALLISSIWTLYGPLTSAPKNLILSLPGVAPDKVEKTEQKLARSTKDSHRKALILDLLESLRGVSVSEMGRIASARDERRKVKSKMQERYMSANSGAGQGMEMDGQFGASKTDDGPDLGGIADMFG